MADREHLLNVRMTPAELAAVKELADRLGVTQSALVRRLVQSARVSPRGERAGRGTRLVVPPVVAVAPGGSEWTQGTERVARAEQGADPLAVWPAFAEAVRARLEAGRAAYGDKSFERPPAELVGELQQEALDLAGWGFVLWCRLEAMRAAMPASTGSES
jgi:hypothetical protein